MSMAARTRWVYTQKCRIQQDRIRGGLQGSHRPVHVAVVPGPDIGQDGCIVYSLPPAPEFQDAAAGALLRGRSHVDFHLRIGRDHRSDVAAVDHRAGLGGGKAALQRDQRRAHLGDGGDDGGGLGDLVGFQVVLGEAGGIIGLRRGNRGRPVIEPALDHHRHADPAIEQPAVEMLEAVMSGEPLGDGALAGGRRAVDGDDHESSAPSPRINSTNPGKLVAMKAASSTPTGWSLASPITSADIASR